MKHSKYLIAMLLTAFAASPLLAAADEEITPVETINNNSNPTMNGSDVIDDATITKNVKKALANNARVANQKVKIETSNGIVTLSGKVNDQQHTAAIIRVVSNVKGVRSVNNQITMGNS